MKSDNLDNKIQDEAAKASIVQAHQRETAEKQVAKAARALEDLGQINDKNLSDLDALLLQAQQLCTQQGLSSDDISASNTDLGMSMIELSEEEKENIQVPYFEKISKVAADDNITWEEYLANVENYAEKNGINLSKDPFDTLLTASEKAEIAERIRSDYTMQKANCDKYDYLIAASCGMASGLIDSFFVGMPEKSKLIKWTDDKADKFIENITHGMWKSDTRNTAEGKSKKMPDDLHKCISYLEQRFHVNYDARYAKDLNVEDGILGGMAPKNHHLKSLAHAPNLIGLIFSILDQFTGEATFVDNGKLIRVLPKKNSFTLQGSNFVSKLYCGFCNWVGHLLSDFVGSSSARDINHGKTGRGSGLPIPFYEMLQFCNFGSFDVNGEKLSLAELSVKVFEKGYDARFGVTMAIPVVLNEIMIRVLWAVKSRYYHKNSWEASIPFGNHPELRRMLLVGHGTLCLVDGADAVIRSGGQIINFALHLNFVAWMRFAFSGLMEVRALYKENALDINKIDKDLEIEWNRLCG